jgi:hypothetical protein
MKKATSKQSCDLDVLNGCCNKSKIPIPIRNHSASKYHRYSQWINKPPATVNFLENFRKQKKAYLEQSLALLETRTRLHPDYIFLGKSIQCLTMPKLRDTVLLFPGMESMDSKCMIKRHLWKRLSQDISVKPNIGHSNECWTCGGSNGSAKVHEKGHTHIHTFGEESQTFAI